jgi:phosphate:Na+ symporter
MPAHLCVASTITPTGEESVGVVIVIMTLLGGLALFLLGMDQMTEALKVIAGERMRQILARLTSNRFMGVATGAGVTAIVQSSSITTVLVVGFVTAGLLTLTQAAGVIMGANVGTTVTAQIIALDVTKYALGIVAMGFAFFFFSAKEDVRARGSVVMGLGLIFLGMEVMGEATSPLRNEPAFVDALASLDSPALGILVGAVFTAVIQSSSATTALILVLASQGLLTLEAAIALILGANIGTSVTALLASIGKPRDALRAAAVHVGFNVGGVLLFLPFIGVLADSVRAIGGGLAREIANAHTLFNVTVTIIFLMFLPGYVRLIQWLIPDRPEAIEKKVQAKYLDRELLRTPPLALDRARMELCRLGRRVRAMLEEALPAVLDGTRKDLTALEAKDDEVDALHGQVVAYLGQISQQALSDDAAAELAGLMEVNNDLEAIGDIIETNLVTLGYSRVEAGIAVSPATRAVIGEFHEAVSRALDTAMVAVAERERRAAKSVSAMKDEINSLERAAASHQVGRLLADEPLRVEAYRLEIDVIGNLKRIYYYAKRIGRGAVLAAAPADA